MKITLSKSQWEMIGSKAGWMKKEALGSGGGIKRVKLGNYKQALIDFISKCKGDGISKEEFDNNFSSFWNIVTKAFNELDQDSQKELQSDHKGLYAQLFFSKFPNHPEKPSTPISLFQNEDLIKTAEQSLLNFESKFDKII